MLKKRIRNLNQGEVLVAISIILIVISVIVLVATPNVHTVLSITIMAVNFLMVTLCAAASSTAELFRKELVQFGHPTGRYPLARNVFVLLFATHLIVMILARYWPWSV